jgi:hypothetical protein
MERRFEINVNNYDKSEKHAIKIRLSFKTSVSEMIISRLKI